MTRPTVCQVGREERQAGIVSIRRWGMPTTLAVGVTAAVVAASLGSATFYSTRHYRSLLESARASALAQGQLIYAALEHQMLEHDRSLLSGMIETFGREKGVEKVVLLDREGRVRFSSRPAEPETRLSLESETCQVCHRLPAEKRETSQVIETGGGKVLRTVVPIRNHAACFGCHDRSHRINGIILVDLSTADIRAAMDRDLLWMGAFSAVIALLLLGAITLVVRMVVTRRLQRFEAEARRIASGDLGQRVRVGGSDTLAWLGEDFNALADTITGLLRDVHGQREQLETVINGIDDAIVVLDPDRRVIAANDAFLRRTGGSRERLLGSTCHETVIGTCGAGDCPTLRCLQTGEGQVRIFERRDPSGSIVWEEVHASPIRRSSGQVVQVVEVWRDISERRAAEARLAESHRLASLGMLASGFSHELNTPLATVLTCVEGIQRAARTGDGADPEWRRIEESASIAREQLLRCRGVTQHFLRLSRGRDAGDCLVDLAAACAAVGRLIEPTARANGVRVVVEPGAPGLVVRVTEADLQHVLLNLLLNSIQACAHEGRVRLAVVPGDPVRIEVVDDGCGISPDNQKRIFEPFFSERRGGTGLGLFLSLEFVRHWGGDIRVRSAPGRGSTFEVVLPAPGASSPLRILS